MDPRRVCIVSTGSQGEPMSALSKMANGDSNFVTVGDGDVVILSSHAIPGNEGSVNRVIDRLMRLGVEVVHSGIADVHVSGHARRGELAMLFNVAQPEWFVPVHGEYRHLWHNAQLAEEMGVDPEKIKISLDGDVLQLDENGLTKVGEVPAAYLYVDGIVGEMSEGVLRDRQMLSEDGVVMVVLTVDVHAGKMVAGPEIITRGWVHAEEAESILDEAAAVVRADLEHSGALTPGADITEVQRRARKALGKFVSDRTKRRPMIVPVIMEV
jgi:ribonuclease J